jgi:integrase/recombinase XerD
MLMETFAQDFTLYLEAEKGYSPLTARSYCYDLGTFFDYLPAEDLEELLQASQQSHSVFCGFRNYAMMCTLIFTGMRRGELINLRTGDLSLGDGVVKVRGKGSKERMIPLVDRAVDAIRDWLEFRPEDCDHDYLFTTTHGNRIHPSRMQRIWRSIFERTDIEDDGVSLHTLRHSMATLLLQSGEASLPEIQRILGHSRLDTTAIYLHVTEGELREAVGAHPLAR